MANISPWKFIPKLPHSWEDLSSDYLIKSLISIYTKVGYKVCRDVWYRENSGGKLCCPLGGLALPFGINWGNGAAAENFWVWTYGKTFVRGFTDGTDPEELPFSNEEGYAKAFKLGLVVSIEIFGKIGGE